MSIKKYEIKEMQQVFESHYLLWEKQYKKYKNYLVDPPEEFLKEKGEIFGIDLVGWKQKVLPIVICALSSGLKHEPLILAKDQPKLPYNPIDPEKYTVTVRPQSIDHLKHLVGVPNEVHEQSKKLNISAQIVQRFAAQMRHLPADFKFEALENKERMAVRSMSMNMVYGYVDAEMMKQQPYANIIDHIMERAETIPAFVGSDLLVCPGESVKFQNYPAIYFNNVIVVGDGQINIGNNAKLHAYQIRHI